MDIPQEAVPIPDQQTAASCSLYEPQWSHSHPSPALHNYEKLWARTVQRTFQAPHPVHPAKPAPSSWAAQGCAVGVDHQVLASLVTESLVTPLALLQDACSSQPCSLHERSRQACLLGCPSFGREGQIRDSSIYLDPLGKTNFFVLSENIWEPGILGRKIRGLKMYTVGEGIRQKAGIWVPLLKG